MIAILKGGYKPYCKTVIDKRTGLIYEFLRNVPLWLGNSLAQGKVRDLLHWYHQYKRQAVKNLPFCFILQGFQRVRKSYFRKPLFREFLRTRLC